MFPAFDPTMDPALFSSSVAGTQAPVYSNSSSNTANTRPTTAPSITSSSQLFDPNNPFAPASIFQQPGPATHSTYSSQQLGMINSYTGAPLFPQSVAPVTGASTNTFTKYGNMFTQIQLNQQASTTDTTTHQLTAQQYAQRKAAVNQKLARMLQERDALIKILKSRNPSFTEDLVADNIRLKEQNRQMRTKFAAYAEASKRKIAQYEAAAAATASKPSSPPDVIDLVDSPTRPSQTIDLIDSPPGSPSAPRSDECSGTSPVPTPGLSASTSASHASSLNTGRNASNTAIEDADRVIGQKRQREEDIPYSNVTKPASRRAPDSRKRGKYKPRVPQRLPTPPPSWKVHGRQDPQAAEAWKGMRKKDLSWMDSVEPAAKKNKLEHAATVEMLTGRKLLLQPAAKSADQINAFVDLVDIDGDNNASTLPTVSTAPSTSPEPTPTATSTAPNTRATSFSSCSSSSSSSPAAVPTRRQLKKKYDSKQYSVPRGLSDDQLALAGITREEANANRAEMTDYMIGERKRRGADEERRRRERFGFGGDEGRDFGMRWNRAGREEEEETTRKVPRKTAGETIKVAEEEEAGTQSSAIESPRNFDEELERELAEFMGDGDDDDDESEDENKDETGASKGDDTDDIEKQFEQFMGYDDDESEVSEEE